MPPPTRTFGGWALSFDDWDKEHKNLVDDLGDKKYEANVYYTVGYNSPWDTENRRNEVWLPISKEDVEASQVAS